MCSTGAGWCVRSCCDVNESCDEWDLAQECIIADLYVSLQQQGSAAMVQQHTGVVGKTTQQQVVPSFQAVESCGS